MVMRYFRMFPLRYHVYGASLLGACCPPSSFADELFNPAMLEQTTATPQRVDLSAFAKKEQQAAGIYHVSLLVNGIAYDPRDIQFINDASGKNSLRPCLSGTLLKDIGVRIQAFSALTSETTSCPDLTSIIPDSQATLEFDHQQLRLTLPQAAMDTRARGDIPSSQWDDGIPALMTSYQFSGAHTRYADSGDSDNQFLNLRNGLNMGPWRLRNNGALTRDDNGSHWDSSATYLQRSIAPLKGELTLGDAFTDGDIFDSVQFRGAHLSSDDNMLPDSMKGFAPVIRGIAKSNARVTVKQNGYVIYQSYVTPGAFAITDLYPTSNSGDLDVSITESDGTETHFTQPYSAVPILQREGRLKYDVVIGKYHQSASQEDPFFGQFSLIQGLPWGVTLYGGSQVADNYQNVALGYGQNLGSIGAISFDITSAWSAPYHGEQHTGQAYRALYSRSFSDTGTTLQLSGYRYSDDNFYTFPDAVEAGSTNSNDENNRYWKKDQLQLTLSQSLSGYGSVYVNASQQRYQNRDNNQRYLQVGYSNGWYGVSYNLSYSYTRNNEDDADDQQFSLNISVPLDRFLPGAWASYSLNTDNRGRTSQQAGLSGTLLKDHNLSYNIQQSTVNQDSGYGGSASASYLGRYGQSNIGYNYSDNQHQINYGASGSVLLHPYGITFSQQSSDTVALIRAPEADNVSVRNQTGVRTDWRGYTVQPYVMPYRKNVVSLDPTTLPYDVELKTSSRTVIPTQGAVVLASFEARRGYRALLTLMYKDKPVPFGAVVADTGNAENSSIVSDNGQVYVAGLSEQGILRVSWGKADNQHCISRFRLPLTGGGDRSLPVMMEATPCQ